MVLLQSYVILPGGHLPETKQKNALNVWPKTVFDWETKQLFSHLQEGLITRSGHYERVDWMLGVPRTVYRLPLHVV